MDIFADPLLLQLAVDHANSELMSGDMATMTAALGSYMGQNQSVARLMHGIAGAVSITIPIIVLVFLFQKQIVSGMTAGAVKG